MRLVFINQKPIFYLDSTSHRFWFQEFKRQADEMLFLDNAGWNIKVIQQFRPDHIHFASDGLPRAMWMPLNKMKLLRKACPKAVLTSYRGGVGKEKELLEKLNILMDQAFGSTDTYRGQTWLPAPADPKFWKEQRRPKPRFKIIYIGHGSPGHVKIMKKRGIGFTKHKYLVAVKAHLPLTIVGSGWEQFGLQHLPQTKNYEENKRYYLDSLIGLNIVHDDLRRFSKYWSSRLMHMMMSGLSCFTPYQPGLETVFTNKIHCVFYHTQFDLIEKLRYYLREEHRGELEAIGRQGQELVCRKYNSQVAVKRILEVKKK